jgi:hypothetical protein
MPVRLFVGIQKCLSALPTDRRANSEVRALNVALLLPVYDGSQYIYIDFSAPVAEPGVARCLHLRLHGRSAGRDSRSCAISRAAEADDADDSGAANADYDAQESAASGNPCSFNRRTHAAQISPICCCRAGDRSLLAHSDGAKALQAAVRHMPETVAIDLDGAHGGAILICRRERGRTQSASAPHHEAGRFALRVPQRCGRFEGCTRASAIRCSSSSVSR